ncbi:hypothetical protein I4F81_004647 [Pyropia yezoensis]|uniref:Uncharacterized protein n=1 Tax=Pyropia yezoensis TaxID=2788 RepID=A0ACC3BX75_PYRYE|nr:hypothetical protein I4F81_004647 [Neopyropia yezoensis]
MMQALLPSLGRAVLADSTWLADPRWRLTADVAVENLHRHVLPDGAERALEAGVWNLRGRLDSRADEVASLGAATTQPTAASSWPRMLARRLSTSTARCGRRKRREDPQRLGIGNEGVCAVPPPTDPAAFADVVIVVVLVVPEAAAAVVLYLSMARWRRREALALAVVLITGLVALLSIFLLALTEVRRERWGAAYLRSSLLVYLTATTGDCVGRTGPHECPSPGLRGSVLLLSASLIIVARKGYHPRTLTAILRENCRDIEAFFLIIREVTPLSWQPPFESTKSY